jgi:hypothetical protein
MNTSKIYFLLAFSLIFIISLLVFFHSVRENNHAVSTRNNSVMSEANLYKYSHERIINQHRNKEIFEILNSTESSFYFKKLEHRQLPIFELTFNSFEIKSNSNYTVIDNVSDSSQFEKCLRAFKGTIMEFEAVDNTIFKISNGYDDFKNKINNLYKFYGDVTHHSPLPTETVFTEKYFTDFLVTHLLVLPKSEIQTNSRWSRLEVFALNDEPIEFQVSYNVKDIKNGVLYLESNGDFSKTISVVNDSTVIIHGKKSGTVQIEINSGMIIKSESSVNTEMFYLNNAEQRILSVNDLTVLDNVKFSDNTKTLSP